MDIIRTAYYIRGHELMKLIFAVLDVSLTMGLTRCYKTEVFLHLSRMQSFKLKFSGVTILQGVKFPIFLLIFEWALQQCSATALPVIVLFLFGVVVLNVQHCQAWSACVALTLRRLVGRNCRLVWSVW